MFFTAVIAVTRSPIAVALGALGCLAAYGLAGWSAMVVLRQVRPLRWWLLVLAPLQVLTAGPRAALVVCGTLVVCVAAASLVTLTTRTSDLLDAIVTALGPLRRLGFEPERVGLVLMLAIRAVPVITDLARQAGDARRARGLERSPRALVVPLAVRTVRHAQASGAALAARGVDD